MILSARSASVVAFGVILSCLAAPSAWAQFGAGGRQQPPPLPTTPAPPPALPGARPGSVAPPTRAPSDLAPNEALFDAVNRGDIAAVRDALSRGAELNAPNLLGITATDLAVDLGWNDIAFLLLSMRGAETKRAGRERPVPTFTAAPKPAPRASGPSRDATRGTVRTSDPVRPRLFAHDGGTPVPSAGFLGFDPSMVVR